MKAVPLLLLKGPHFKIHFGSLDTKNMYLNNIYLLHGCVGDMKIRPLPQEKNHISHEQRQSFGLLNN